MKKLFYALSMSFGMFCAIPNPIKRWDDAARPLMTVCLPVVGLILGAIWAAAAWLLGLAGITGAVGAAVMTVLPFLLTGFIHLDGFMDCSDAILSRRDLETRRKILKDSHCGAFAVIAVVILMLLTFAAFCDYAYWAQPWALVTIPVASRCVSAVSVMVRKPLTTSQYEGGFRRRVKKSYVASVGVMLTLALAASLLVFGWYGLGTVVCTLVSTVMVQYGVKDLGGMSGDISGYGLTIGECAGVLTLAVVTMIGGLA